jgi:hypothetical protein
MPTDTKAFVWKGEHKFQIIGTDHHEDTIKILANVRNSESLVRLILPTLAITYADMKFTNAIGGVQENYPASGKYGKKYFDPPVVIKDEKEIEKYTWIRGARKVTIGPETTEIEWYIFKDLIVPRLRIDRKKALEAVVSCSPVSIDVRNPLRINVLQFADGRHIGGVRIEKRHPDWKPQEQDKKYDLTVRVSDSRTLQSLKERPVNFFRWSDKESTPYGVGGFKKIEQKYTDGNGSIRYPDRISDVLEAITVNIAGRASVARCFRALPGQVVRHEIRSWPLEKEMRDFVWTGVDTLDGIAVLTGVSAAEVLKTNGLSDAASLKPGMKIHLPCYAASCQMEPGDTFEGLVKAFVYRDTDELANLNKLKNLAEWDGKKDILLTGWNFMYARHGDTLERIDKLFGLPAGCSRTLGRVHHPDPRIPFESEIVAVPTEEFVKKHFA